MITINVTCQDSTWIAESNHGCYSITRLTVVELIAALLSISTYRRQGIKLVGNWSVAHELMCSFLDEGVRELAQHTMVSVMICK